MRGYRAMSFTFRLVMLLPVILIVAFVAYMIFTYSVIWVCKQADRFLTLPTHFAEPASVNECYMWKDVYYEIENNKTKHFQQ